MQTWENGKSGCVGGSGGWLGLEGAFLVQEVQWALVEMISCFIPGQKTDWAALDIMLVLPV